MKLAIAIWCRKNCASLLDSASISEFSIEWGFYSHNGGYVVDKSCLLGTYTI